MVVHTFDPRTQEAEADGSLWVQKQSKFQDCQGYTEKPSLEKKNNVHSPIWPMCGMYLIEYMCTWVHVCVETGGLTLSVFLCGFLSYFFF